MVNSQWLRAKGRYCFIAVLLLLLSVSASAQKWRGVKATPELDTSGNVRFNLGDLGLYDPQARFPQKKDSTKDYVTPTQMNSRLTAFKSIFARKYFGGNGVDTAVFIKIDSLQAVKLSPTAKQAGSTWLDTGKFTKLTASQAPTAPNDVMRLQDTSGFSRNIYTADGVIDSIRTLVIPFGNSLKFYVQGSGTNNYSVQMNGSLFSIATNTDYGGSATFNVFGSEIDEDVINSAGDIISTRSGNGSTREYTSSFFNENPYHGYINMVPDSAFIGIDVSGNGRYIVFNPAKDVIEIKNFSKKGLVYSGFGGDYSSIPDSGLTSKALVASMISSAGLGFTPENVANKVTSLDASSTHYPSSSAVKTVTDANNTAIGLKQPRIILTDPGASAATIATGDSVNMALWKLQKQVNISIIQKRDITAATTITNTDRLINITSGNFTQPLPSSLITGQAITIKNSGAGIITITATSIDGNTAISLSPGDGRNFVYTGTSGTYITL